MNTIKKILVVIIATLILLFCFPFFSLAALILIVYTYYNVVSDYLKNDFRIPTISEEELKTNPIKNEETTYGENEDE